MYKKIDGKTYNLIEVTQEDYLIEKLLENSDRYETILKQILELEQNIEEQEKGISSIEYTAEYDVINQKDESGKELNTNETKRKLAKLDILSKNDVYRDAIKSCNNNKNTLKLLQNTVKTIEFQSGIYKRILEYRGRKD